MQIRLAKEEYYSDIIKENMHNSKGLWKSLKLLLYQVSLKVLLNLLS